MTTNQRTVGGKPFPYKYKHNQFRRTPYGGVYDKIRAWLHDNFESTRSYDERTWWSNGVRVAYEYRTLAGSRYYLVVVYDAEA